jgi:hypothetical protein
LSWCSADARAEDKRVSHGVVGAIAAALGMALRMGWEILWALVLGFALSGVV